MMQDRHLLSITHKKKIVENCSLNCANHWVEKEWDQNRFLVQKVFDEKQFIIVISPLKVVNNENEGSSGRWQMLGAAPPAPYWHCYWQVFTKGNAHRIFQIFTPAGHHCLFMHSRPGAQILFMERLFHISRIFLGSGRIASCGEPFGAQIGITQYD